MQKTLESFVKYLNNRLEKQSQIMISNMVQRRSYDVIDEDEMKLVECAAIRMILRNIEVPYEDWSKHKEVFSQFDLLSAYLVDSNLTNDECVKIVFYMLEKNIATSFLDGEAEFVDPLKIRDYKFKYLKVSEVEKMIIDDSYYELLDSEDDELSELDRLKKQEFLNFAEQSSLNMSGIVDKHHIMREHYFSKDSMNYEDLEIVLKTLQDLGCSVRIVRFAKNYLSRKYNISKPVVETNVKKIDKVVLSASDDKMSLKEYNKLKRELGMYFNLDDMTAKKELSLEKQVYCLCLMKKMGMSNDKIDRVLRIIKKLRKNREQHPIERFMYLLNKLEYYSYIPDVGNRLDELKDCFKDIFMIDDESYRIYKEYIELLLDEILQFIPNSYEYEYQAAEQYSLKLS